MEYYPAIKKRWNPVICGNMGNTGCEKNKPGREG